MEISLAVDRKRKARFSLRSHSSLLFVGVAAASAVEKCPWRAQVTYNGAIT